MKYYYSRVFRYLAFTILVTALLPVTALQAAEHCADQFYIDTTLPNGARWDLCWEQRNREGVVYHHIHYTPKDSTNRRMVMFEAAIAQIHVPYDDNGARFHDVSDYGLGGSALISLSEQECPNGQLIQYSNKNIICQQVSTRQLAYSALNSHEKGYALHVFSVSETGNYNYIALWKFYDNGTIEPWMGATGALQRFTVNLPSHTPFGWPVSDDPAAEIGISHLHNYYWRLDFDLGNTNTDDFVEEINFNLNNGARERVMTRFNTEVAREYNPQTYRSWRVVDGEKNANNHAMSYEIRLQDMGHRDHGPAVEPFTTHDFFLTKSNVCERFASHNPTNNGSCGRNLAEFVNGEAINAVDTTIWASTTFYHMPRSEDMPHMDVHWSHLQLKPRDWHAKNPLQDSAIINHPAQLNNPGPQVNSVGEQINLAIQANDADGDPLSYSATALPVGLQIDSVTGLITGVLQSAGSTTSKVSVHDGSIAVSIAFDWSVSRQVDTGINMRVWEDNNANGLRDDTDEPISAVMAWLFTDSWQWVDENISNAQGEYLFKNLADGNYFLCVDEATYPDSHLPTLKNAGDDTIDSDINIDGCSDRLNLSGNSDVQVDVGLASTQTLSLLAGRAWDDVDNNGLRIIGTEPGIASITVWLFNNNWLWQRTTQTDQTGQYQFNGLSSGTYNVCFNQLDVPTKTVTLKDAGDDKLDSDAEFDACVLNVELQQGANKVTVDIGFVNQN